MVTDLAHSEKKISQNDEFQLIFFTIRHNNFQTFVKNITFGLLNLSMLYK